MTQTAWKKLAIPLVCRCHQLFWHCKRHSWLPYNLQREEVEDDIEAELCIAASDAEHGNWRNCGSINQRVKHSIREIGGTRRHSMADRGRKDKGTN